MLFVAKEPLTKLYDIYDRYYLQYRTAGDDHVRPAHAALNGVTLPPSDSFWTDYYPPNGWNCRCTVVQVRKSKYPATPHDEAMSLGEDALGDDKKGIFRFNSGQQQKTMPDYNPYTIRRCNDCDVAKGKATLAKPLNCDLCHSCKRIHELWEEKIRLLKKRKRHWQELRKNPQYKNVVFNKETGGLKATHIGHITHSSEKETIFFNQYTSTQLEENCQNELYRIGHEAILCDESKRKPDGNLYTALDMGLDGIYMDIRSITSARMYGNALLQKNKQLLKYNQRPDINRPSDSVCLYFEMPDMFDEKKMKSSINYFKFFRNNKGELIEHAIRHVYVVIKGAENIRIYDI